MGITHSTQTLIDPILTSHDLTNSRDGYSTNGRSTEFPQSDIYITKSRL